MTWEPNKGIDEVGRSMRAVKTGRNGDHTQTLSIELRRVATGRTKIVVTASHSGPLAEEAVLQLLRPALAISAKVALSNWSKELN